MCSSLYSGHLTALRHAGEDLDGWSQGRRPRSRRATSEGGAASDQASRRSTGGRVLSSHQKPDTPLPIPSGLAA